MGRGGLARGLQDPFLSRTSFVRPTPPHAILYPVFHHGKSLGAGVSRSPPQTSHRAGSSDSRLLQSPICGPEGFRGVAPHHRPVYPEHLYCVSALSYGDSSVRPPFHSPRRLDDLLGSAGRVPSSSGQVNLRKSSLVPSQDMTNLGMQILSVRFVAKPTETRVVNLLNIIEEFLSSPDPPAALWRRLLGHLSSLTLLVKGGMLRMRSLQIRLRSKCNFRDDSLRISWDPLCQEDLLWWSWAIQQREGVDLSLPVPDLSFYSDASDVGWGAIVREHQVSGVWTPSQREVSINLREMMAVQNGLLQFSSLLRGKTIALFCDNVTTVAYLRRSGGTRSQVLFLKAREILLWVESMKITLLPQFIQGSLNTRADLLSRPNLVIGSEWTLHQEVVQGLLHQWPAIIDLFATSLMARLPVFFAPAWEPRAAGVDAFLQPWDNLQAYAFPPIAIIRRVLLKLRTSHHCDLTLIAPFWPQREWFPDLLELLSDIPIELPKRRDLLRQPHFHRFHENLPMLRLTAWRLSSDSPVRQASLKQWLANLPSVGEHLLD